MKLQLLNWFGNAIYTLFCSRSAKTLTCKLKRANILWVRSTSAVLSLCCVSCKLPGCRKTLRHAEIVGFWRLQLKISANKRVWITFFLSMQKKLVFLHLPQNGAVKADLWKQPVKETDVSFLSVLLIPIYFSPPRLHTGAFWQNESFLQAAACEKRCWHSVNPKLQTLKCPFRNVTDALFILSRAATNHHFSYG